MKVTFLGQAGFSVETKEGRLVLDPYLSDSVGKANPKKYRRVPTDESRFDLRPDLLLFTHDHLDHYDPETAERFLLNFPGMTVLSPRSVWERARKVTKEQNFVLMKPRTRWTEKGFSVTAVRAFHSDPDALGFLVTAEGKTLYFTGDTLYNEEIFADLPAGIEAVFLPVNGEGNNMNFADGASFAEKTGARRVFPCHCGTLDDIDLAAFPCERKEILVPYRPFTV